MTMTEALYEIAPNTTKMFASWLMESYGLKLSEFEKATPKRKYFEVSRYFGYPLEQDTQLPVADIIAFIKKTFFDYEDIMHRYPDGVPNFLYKLKEMPNTEKDVWLAKHFTRTINLSLHHAIILGTKLIRISLNSALIDRQLTKLELSQKFEADKNAAESKFWNDIIKNFNANEIPPF